MLHNHFRAERILSRWRVRPSYGESATTYFASLVADSEDCTPFAFAQQAGLLSGPNPALPILEALLRLPLSNEEKASLVRWTPMTFTESRSVELCGHHISINRCSDIGAYCPECIREAAYHRVWWNLQGFVTCPIHDIPIVVPKRPSRNHVQFSIHGIAKKRVASPPILSEKGRDSYEGYLLQALGAVAQTHPRPLLDDQPLDERIKAVQVLGRFLSNPKVSERTPPMKPGSMAVGFNALKHDIRHLEDRFSDWLILNYTEAELQHVTLEQFGYLKMYSYSSASKSLKERLIAAKLSAAARHGKLPGQLRRKPGVSVPLQVGGLAKETSVSRHGIEALLRMLWPDMPQTEHILEVPHEVAARVRAAVKELVPVAQAAKLLRCRSDVAMAMTRLFALDGKVVAVTVNKGQRRSQRCYIKEHLDWMVAAVDSIGPAPAGIRTVTLDTYVRHHKVLAARVYADVILGRTRAYCRSNMKLAGLLFEGPPRTRRSGKPANLGRIPIPEDAMLTSEFHGITGATGSVAAELVKRGFLKTHGDGRGHLDRASVLEFHKLYVNPVRYLMGRGMRAIDAIWALKKMELPLVFQHEILRPYFARRTDLEARIGPLHQPTAEIMEVWRALIRQGRENCPSFIIPEVPGDGPTYVYTSTRLFSFRVIFEDKSLQLKARFASDSRRIWKVYQANVQIFQELLGSFDWQTHDGETIATVAVSSDDDIRRVTAELGKLASHFRYKMP
ncbi:hypothetical protein ACVMH6_007002 [Rhizobium leguminosarum]